MMNTKQTEALKLALEAICGSGDFLFNWHDCEPNNEREMQQYQATLAANENAFKVIREALAEESSGTEQPAQQDIPDLIAGAIGVSRGTAYDLMREALAEQPAQQQEPVLWQILNGVCHAGVRSTENLAREAAAGMQKAHDLGGSLAAFHVRPLYTSPPASKPLTDEQIMEMYNEPRSDAEMIEFARAIEAAHGIKGDA